MVDVCVIDVIVECYNQHANKQTHSLSVIELRLDATLFNYCASDGKLFTISIITIYIAIMKIIVS